jgi:hypothetical protein
VPPLPQNGLIAGPLNAADAGPVPCAGHPGGSKNSLVLRGIEG